MIGIFSKTIDSNLIESAGFAGLDFIIVDQEHGPASRENLHNHARAAANSAMKVIVRVGELSENAIGSALDAGADGVQVPNVATAQQAKKAIQAARFYPEGSRGVCRFVKAASFGTLDKAAYFEKENKKLLVLQVEGKEGLANIEDILALEGFDILFVGPYDLSQSLGLPGQVTHPKVMEAIESLREKTLKAGKKLGTFADNLEVAKRFYENGFDYMAYSVDLNIFSEACKSIKNRIQK